jgi:deoxyribodipyrimidine photolyase-related protein
VSHFLDVLEALQPASDAGRTWIFVPDDQLTHFVGPLSRAEPGQVGIVLLESSERWARRPYHKQKLVFALGSARHFAIEQARRGVAVRYLIGDGAPADLLRPTAIALGGLAMMEAAEREMREDLRPLIEAAQLSVLPNETWLTSPDQFRAAFEGDRPWRMDRFYREVRRATGVLMKGGKPVGGRFSFDGENRKAWRGDPPAPAIPTFEVDPISQEVVDLVEAAYADNPGQVTVTSLALRADQVEEAWQWAKDSCLAQFGPYEDAMSLASPSLFHTRISALLNNARLLPRDVVDDSLALELPLASREGFVRQILGWREFVRHVHRETDGFRTIQHDGRPNALEATSPLPPAFWGVTSGLGCLDHVVGDVWATGYGHHITRLMILSNLATLLGVEPAQVSEWFRVAYADAHDWVVEPNVLGMGTFAMGDLFTTKPYVSGASYIRRMSDYCRSCDFSPSSDCPVTSLYWDFLDRNADPLAGNHRMSMPLRSLGKRSDAKRADDREVARRCGELLRRGEVVRPALLREEGTGVSPRGRARGR